MHTVVSGENAAHLISLLTVATRPHSTGDPIAIVLASYVTDCNICSTSDLSGIIVFSCSVVCPKPSIFWWEVRRTLAALAGK